MIESVENILSFKISIAGHVIAIGKIFAVSRTKNSVDLSARPDIEFTFLALGIGVERGTKCAFRRGHLADQPIESLLGTLQKQLLAAASVGEGEQFQNFGVVIEHFLKMRDQPFFIDGAARETSAQGVIDAALAHMLERQLHEFKESRLASAHAGTPKQFQHGALREIL